MNSCPGCGARLGRFAAQADGEQFNTVACTRTGATYVLQQDVPRRPPMPGAKLLKHIDVDTDTAPLAALWPPGRRTVVLAVSYLAGMSSISPVT